MDSLMIHRSIPCLNLLKKQTKTSPFLCSLSVFLVCVCDTEAKMPTIRKKQWKQLISVFLVGNKHMLGHVDHIPRMHCLGDYCIIRCYTNRLFRVLRIDVSPFYKYTVLSVYHVSRWLNFAGICPHHCVCMLCMLMAKGANHDILRLGFMSEVS